MMNSRIANVKLLTNHRLRRVVISILIITAVVATGLPYAMQYGLQRWLISQGATYIEIEDIDFNPFTGTLVVKNLKSGDDNIPYIQIGEASASINWLPVFRNRFYFDNVLIKDSLLNIEKRDDDSLRVGVFTIKQPSIHEKKNKPVGIGAKKIAVLNTRIDYLSTDLKFTASIRQMNVGRLSDWKPAYTTPVELDTSINSGDLRFIGSMKPFSDRRPVTGHLRMSHIPMEIFTSLLLPDSVSSKGSLEADVQINTALSAEQQGNEPPLPSHMQHILDGNISLHDLWIGDKDKQHSLWESGKISLNKIRISEPNSILIDAVDIQNATANLHRNSQGKWLVIQDMLDSLADTKKPSADPLSIQVSQVNIGAKSIVNIHDQMTAPVFQSRIEVDKAVISHVDNSHPEQASDLLLAGRIDEHSEFTVSGQLQPFSQKANLAINGVIKSLDLPPFTTYTKQHLGYVLKSGHMDSDVDVKITDDVIDGIAKLQINNLQITADDPDKMKTLSTQLSMPLETAVSMLRDSNNNIKMQVPVKGNIRDPAFDFSDAINQALGNATKTAALGYLKYTLGPFGTLITVGQLAGGLVSGIMLEPIKFEAGKAELDDIDINYLQHVAELLSKRPKLRINICGNAVVSDRAVLLEQGTIITDQDLLALAKQRASVVKQYLVKQHTVASERLFLCNPEILPAADATPQAGLSI